ncbi:MAG: biotin/lipoyl-binding protein [Clostridia bacterium]|nr:biotin/lipoyl-binding protein [Clostridia bacterium]MBR2328828.1 biotin/lipoyl-binding protein [Clostridia bacterium]
MRKFLVNVNGTSYEVEVEEIAAGAAPAAAPAPVAAAPAAAPAPVAAPVAAPAGAASVTAPMPGNILDVKVKVGDVVSENTVVVLLEAMKMENEIFAGVNGKVTAVNVAKGATVNSGDVLVVIG